MQDRKNILVLIPVLIMALLIIFYGFGRNLRREYDLKIYFFNAGKADAILISKGDHYIMIDTGEESLSEEILNYFKNNNIEKLDYLIITHFDKDHVGSASSIIDNVEIGTVLESNVPKDSEYYDNYLESLSNKSLTPITVSGDYDITVDDINITVNGPTTIYDSSESNNSSLIVSLTYKDNKFLFMGDAENDRIKDFLKSNDETYDFLKVPYHGNYLKRLEDLLKEKEIKYAVITSSNAQPESDSTIEVLKKYDIDYYLTRKGSISILSNGESIKIVQ